MAEGAAIPVVLQGLGPIGQAIGRAVLERPDLRIAAAVDPAHAGKSLAELLGPTAPPITIAADVAKAYAAARGGAVLHATSSSFEAVLPQLQRAVDAKLAVISTCEELAWPWLRAPEAADALDARAEAKDVAVLGVGVNPGFVLDRLPVFLAQVTGAVRHVRALRVVDAAARREGLRRKVGFGLDEDAFLAAADDGKVGHVGLAESAALVAAGCGFEIDEYEDEIEPVVADEDFAGPPAVRRGQVVGARQVVRGFAEGAERVRLELEISVHADDPRDEVELDAQPPVRAVVKGGIAGDLAAAWAVVNAVPAVLEMRGLVTVLDLPAGR
ncbi:MAG: dihydrodipicolinate reductase [Anaeromyxobacteraceae bacterium]